MYTPAKLNNGEDAVYDEEEGLGYGFGWATGRDEALGLIVSHSGGMPGVGTWFERFIDADAVLVILGCRDFDQPGIPPRSVAGNKTTSRFFRLLFGIRLSDTQTGLRAIPRAFLERFLRVEGDRFEYETNMLLKMKRWGIGFEEMPITTVYDPEDYSSHYNAVKDSWRIFKIMFKGLFR